MFEPTKQGAAEMTIARTKLYLHGEKIAHHAVHISEKTEEGAKELTKLIRSFSKSSYQKNSTYTMRQAASSD